MSFFHCRLRGCPYLRSGCFSRVPLLVQLLFVGRTECVNFFPVSLSPDGQRAIPQWLAAEAAQENLYRGDALASRTAVAKGEAGLVGTRTRELGKRMRSLLAPLVRLATWFAAGLAKAKTGMLGGLRTMSAGIKRGATATATGIKRGATATASGIKSAATASATAIKPAATATATAIKRGATATASGIRSGATAAAAGVKRGATAAGAGISRLVSKKTPTPAPEEIAPNDPEPPIIADQPVAERDDVTTSVEGEAEGGAQAGGMQDLFDSALQITDEIPSELEDLPTR